MWFIFRTSFSTWGRLVTAASFHKIETRQPRIHRSTPLRLKEDLIIHLQVSASCYVEPASLFFAKMFPARSPMKRALISKIFSLFSYQFVWIVFSKFSALCFFRYLAAKDKCFGFWWPFIRWEMSRILLLRLGHRSKGKGVSRKNAKSSVFLFFSRWWSSKPCLSTALVRRQCSGIKSNWIGWSFWFLELT